MTTGKGEKRQSHLIEFDKVILSNLAKSFYQIQRSLLQENGIYAACNNERELISGLKMK